MHNIAGNVLCYCISVLRRKIVHLDRRFVSTLNKQCELYIYEKNNVMFVMAALILMLFFKILIHLSFYVRFCYQCFVSIHTLQGIFQNILYSL